MLNENVNPVLHARWFSKIFLWYSIELFKKCTENNVSILYDVLEEDRSKKMAEFLECKWQEQMDKAHERRRKPSLFRALWTFQYQYFCKTTLLIILELMCRLSEPCLLGIIISYFEPKENMFTQLEVYSCTFALIFVSCVSAIIHQHVALIGYHMGLKAKVACTSLIYRKLLQLNQPMINQGTVGKLVNLLTNDVSKLDNIFSVLQNIWIAIICTCVAVYLIWCQVHISAFIGVACIVFVLFLQSYCGYLMTKYRLQTAEKTDERVQIMDEIISGIQVIKMYAWERPFASALEKARNLEIWCLHKRYYVRSLLSGLNWCLSRVVFYCILFFLVYQNHHIPSANVYVTVAYLSFLLNNGGCMWMAFYGIMDISECWITIHRIQEFLVEAEDVSNADLKFQFLLPDSGTDNEVIVFNNVSVACSMERNILTNVSFKILQGQFAAIVGPVGTGKTSLLLTILGELPLSKGDRKLKGRLSYASQEPWVLTTSIRDNILLGKKYDKKRYKEVIRICALNKDFNQLENGDLTVVGERGATLSGGQRARLNLARALYSDADIYLLDDPLSAVDINVGKQLYDECIMKYLYRKTIVLVTHQLNYARDADVIFVMSNGKIENGGTFDTLKQNENYMKLFSTEEKMYGSDNERVISSTYSTLSYYSWNRNYSTSISRKSEITLAASHEDETQDNLCTAVPQSNETSSIVQYLGAGNSWFFILFVILLFVLSQVLMSSGDYWLSLMVNNDSSESEKETNNEVIITACVQNTFGIILSDPFMSLYVYGGLVFGHLLLCILSAICFFSVCMSSSKELHRKVFHKIIHGKMKFFNCNTSGQILNRFSKDMGVIDESLPKWMLDIQQILMFAIGSFVISTVVNYLYILPTVVIGIPFCFIVRLYIKATRNLRYIEAKTKSPVLLHLNTTVQGLSSIHAYNAEEYFKEKFDKAQDMNTSANYMLMTARCANGLWLSLLNNVYVACIIIGFLIYRGGTHGSDVGLVISQCLTLTKLLQFGMKQFAEVAVQLVAVERVMEYFTIEQEEKEDSNKSKTKSQEIEKGQIEFHKVSLKYVDNSPEVIKDLTLTIQPGEKIGVVGRTGAGKSSIMSAILRLSDFEGLIFLDNIDTKDMKLDHLRGSVSVIPQEPILFSGTIRYNLDPFNNFSDSELLNALVDVNFNDSISSKTLTLETEVQDGGKNFSVGERQMICLARAVLRNNKILIADEATANVDSNTDSIIHNIIREKCKNCTVITIAHRLSTVIDSDKILVMDQGVAVEYDHPHILLQNRSGHFYKMARQSHTNAMEHLKMVAKQNYKNAFHQKQKEI